MGKVVHKKPENSAEVVLRSGHCDLYRNGCLGVTVATGKGNKQTAYSFTMNVVKICRTSHSKLFIALCFEV